MAFADDLEKEMNTTATGNGDVTYASTLNANLDLFSKAGGVRSNNYYGGLAVDNSQYEAMFRKALDEDDNLALRNLLNIRDFRHDGKGERDLFRDLLVELTKTNDSLAAKLIHTGIVQELGRWDDLVYVFDNVSETSVTRSEIILSFALELKEVANGKSSLLPKWLPTNTRNKKAYATAKKLAKAMGYSYSEYRKLVVAGRKSLNLIETNLTDKTYDKVKIENIPSRAFKKYSTSLFTNMNDKMQEFFEKVNSGEAKVKVTGVTPNEILAPIINSAYYGVWAEDEKPDDNQLKLITAQWEELKRNNADVDNTVLMADVSGSMWGVPMTVSVSLAMLFAQTATGAFHNKFMTFSSEPTFISLSDSWTLTQCVNTVLRANWQMSTDIDKAFQKILDTAVDAGTPADELPTRLVIISDMQFNSGYSTSEPHIKRWKKNFAEAGYKLPDVIYWNVSSYANSPAEFDEQGVALLSGFTPGTLNAVIGGEDITPISIMKNALNKPEYDVVDKILDK